MSIQQTHNNKIIEQFNQQAIPFAKMEAHMDAIDILLSLSNVKVTDNVLDVACGPGLVSCAFAAKAHHVTGIDITHAMIDAAITRQSELKLNNLSWDIGDVGKLPYAQSEFDIVLSRYAFHHFINPDQVFAEMVRVCKAGGKILLVDVAIPESKQAAYNYIETLRDPSHTNALTRQQIESLFTRNKLYDVQYATYTVDVALKNILSASFPNSGDGDKLYKLISADVGTDNLGINARQINGEIHFSFPIVAYIAQK